MKTPAKPETGSNATKSVESTKGASKSEVESSKKTNDAAVIFYFLQGYFDILYVSTHAQD